jgi:hypothetical protein
LPWWIPSLIEFVMMSGETAPKATPIITISSRMMLSNNNGHIRCPHSCTL